MLIRLHSGEVVSNYGFRRLFPHVSFPRHLTPIIVQRFGGAVVIETQPPTYDVETQYPAVEGVEQVDGEWRQKWVIKNFTAAQLKERERAVAETERSGAK